MNKDQKLLAEAYNNVLGNNVPDDLKTRIESKAGMPKKEHHLYLFGKTSDGKVYGVVKETDTYSDGDRWIDEVEHFYQVEGEEGKYVSDKLGKSLIQHAGEYPELNKHINKDDFDYFTGKTSWDEYKERRYS
jgi:hypothetical protein